MTAAGDRLLRNARGPVGFGIRRLASSHPFHAVLIDRWRIVSDNEVGTMGVCLGSDLRVELRFDPDFVIGLKPDELVGVLLHEINHVLFHHIAMPESEYQDRTALVVAQEVTVNEFIPGPLPGSPLLLEQYPGLPPMESTRQRYQRLAQTPGSANAGEPAGQFSAQASTSKGDEGPTRPAADGDSSLTVGDAPQTAEGQGPQAQHMDMCPVSSLDNHDIWAPGIEAGAATLEVITAADVEDALNALPPDQRAASIDELSRTLTPHAGDAPGDALLRILGGGKSHTDWRGVLRSFVWQLTQPTPTYRRPARRFPDLVGIVPGRSRNPHRPRVMAVLDTSGSMIDDLMLQTIQVELHELSMLADILVVECDVEIHREYQYMGKVREVVGGGGTSFVEPLSDSFLSARKVDAVLYFTDGEGQPPQRPPRVPVFWCLVGPQSQKPTPWGMAITLQL